MLHDAFEPARLAAADKAAGERNEDLATEIRAMWFYDLRSKAADDVADDRGELAASEQLGRISIQITKRHYLRHSAKVKATK
ncbi:hypothetical protein GCM10027082_39260 [Comamonas humi]